LKKVIEILKEYFKNIIKSIIRDDFANAAGEMAYMTALGIFPFMLFLMAVFGWVGKHYFMDPVFIFLQNIMPYESINLIKTVLNEVMFFSKGGVIALIGFAITLILSTNTLAIVLKGLNRAYKIDETRSFLYTRLLSFVMVLVDTLVLFLSINLIIFGKIIVKFLVTYLNMTEVMGTTMLVVRWPLTFLALYLMSYLHYYILPDLKGKEAIRRRSALKGTLFFCVLWLVGSWGFSVYVNNLHTYNFVYGTIGAFAVLMVWLYYTSILVLIGGEINSQDYYKLERACNIEELRSKNENQ